MKILTTCKTRFFCLLIVISTVGRLVADDSIDDARFRPADVFQLEYATDPQIDPAGWRVVYVRNSMDIMTDRVRSRLWMVDAAGSDHRPLTAGEAQETSPRWSPDGKRLVYISASNGSTQVHLRWMDTGQTARLTNLTSDPGSLAWSPDGKSIAFAMLVREQKPAYVEMPEKPKGAEWAKPPKVIDKLRYRYDGQGYLEDGYYQLFVLSADGGTPRQLTGGDFHHGGPLAWSRDGKSILFSANRRDDWRYEPVESDIYELTLADRSLRPLTDRRGPDSNPVVSPDGKQIAYVGFDDELMGYHNTRLCLMNRDGGGKRILTEEFDRSVQNPRWAGDGRGLYFQYDDRGDTKIGYVSLKGGKVETVADHVGGTTIGRPYASGSFSLAGDRVAFTETGVDHPADVAVARRGESKARRITRLNDDLLAHKQLGAVEELHCQSSHDGRMIHGWIVKPPGYEAGKKYPLLLEIHGGPFANYGGRFAAEIQLYAAAGYVVLYVNPRGSTGYGNEFANLIHHNYPGEDYDDLMSAVDETLSRGYVDAEQLYVTGGSGGGVLSSWIVGQTDRFRAAVVAKPVINWYSFALTSDAYNFFYKYWFPGLPWDHPEHYLKRSPISNAGNINTPTMLLTGEADYRTPISESEQLYQALKLRKIDTVLVRVPDASHGIASRPSLLIAKVAHVLKWFELHNGKHSD